MTELPDGVFDLQTQRDANDCAPTCLSIYLGIPYATVRAACPKKLGDGLTTRQIVNVARKLGHPLRLQTDFDTNDIGIIDLWRKKGSKYGESGHVAFFLRGAVWTTASGQMWADLHTYARNHDWDVLGLLTRADAPLPDRF